MIEREYRTQAYCVSDACGKVDYITHTWIGQCANSKLVTDTGSHVTLRYSMPIRSILSLYHILLLIPYSAKFSRHLYFVEWPLKVFRCTIFVESLLSLLIFADNSNNFCGLNFRVGIAKPQNPRKLSTIRYYTAYACLSTSTTHSG